jgi:phenylalanyl-tRNA synthetase beta chain
MCLKKIINKLFGKHEATKFPSVVVGEIIELSKHPNADKLQLTKVNTGRQVLAIVCGAWNIKIGDKVPTALMGAKLPNGLVIKEATIRGEKSYGMLCSADELGLGTDHTGIVLLKPNATIGRSIDNFLT